MKSTLFSKGVIEEIGSLSLAAKVFPFHNWWEFLVALLWLSWSWSSLRPTWSCFTETGNVGWNLRPRRKRMRGDLERISTHFMEVLIWTWVKNWTFFEHQILWPFFVIFHLWYYAFELCICQIKINFNSKKIILYFGFYTEIHKRCTESKSKILAKRTKKRKNIYHRLFI